MSSDAKRFFIALLPPQPIQTMANEIKHYIADRYDSRAAQKSPPHITLQPPFEWQLSDLPRLESHVAEFAQTQMAISIVQDGFSAFPPRVIFIAVERSPELFALQANLAIFLAKHLQLVDERSQGRSFHPHMTVAFRDLTRQNFVLAWQELRERSLHVEWTATHLTLLIHTGEQWVVHREFPFQPNLCSPETSQ